MKDIYDYVRLTDDIPVALGPEDEEDDHRISQSKMDNHLREKDNFF